MILDLPITNERDAVRNQRRVPATGNEMGRRPASGLPPAGSKYVDVMSQVESDKALKPALEADPIKSTGISFWQEEEFGFGDFLDIINPLHHIPVVATVYRNLTADRIGVVPRVVGGALWGRVGGFVAGLVNAAVEWFTGKDIGDHIFAAIWGEKTSGNNPVAAQTHVGRLSGRKETALPSTEVRLTPGELLLAPLQAPMLEAQDHTNLDAVKMAAEPGSPIPSAPGEAFLKQLPGINHWHDPLQVDAIVTSARLRLTA